MIHLILTLIFVIFSSAFAQDISPKIVGGRKVEAHEHLSSVALTYKRKIYCSGVLIAKDLVLTAAHCVQNLNKDLLTDFKIYFGPGTSDGVVEEENLISVKKYMIHPEYLIRSSGYFDLAIIQMEKEANLNPAKMIFGASQLEKNLKAGADVLIVGYGKRDKEFGGRKEGLKYEANTKISYRTQQEVLLSVPGVDACQGDSGGGAFIRSNKGDEILFGIVSRGGQECNGLAKAYWGLTDSSICWMEETTRRTFTEKGYCEQSQEIPSSSFISFCKANTNTFLIQSLFMRFNTSSCRKLFKTLNQQKHLDLSNLKLKRDTVVSYFPNAQTINLSFNFLTKFESILKLENKSLNIFGNEYSWQEIQRFNTVAKNIELNNVFTQNTMIEGSLFSQTCERQETLDLDLFLSLEKLGFDTNLKFCKQSAFDFYQSKNEFKFLNSDQENFEFKLKSISGMLNLKNVVVKNSNLKNFKDVYDLPNLESLNLADNLIENVEELVALINANEIGGLSPKLKIDLTRNPISSLAPFENSLKPIELTLFGSIHLKCPQNKNISCRF